MNDATLVWGSDLVLSSTGDISLASGLVLGQQRILRRLLTNVNDYVWHPNYGAGLGKFVGETTDERKIAGTIKTQMLEEAAVAHQPSPVVAINEFGGDGVVVSIGYVDALNGGTQSLTFTVGN